MGFFDHTGECSLTSARTASPVPITVFSGVKRGFRGNAVDGRNPFMIEARIGNIIPETFDHEVYCSP
jgi:hypothetical protein